MSPREDILDTHPSISGPLLVTGGAGFIGANFVLRHLRERVASGTSVPEIVVLDALTYAGNVHNLDSVCGHPGLVFVHGDILDASLVTNLLRTYRPRAIVHFAAESHVDRSIVGPSAFLKTNVEGTFNLLECARAHHGNLTGPEHRSFRFLHVSTDEVYGTLEPDAPAFHEKTPYAPNSPYAASKAASDHLARAWQHTYGLPVLVTNCSNNYGPFQFPEKLIPLVIAHAVAGKPLPVYGDGQQVRDWLFVEDHCAALEVVLERGTPGQTYAIGGNHQQTNLSVVQTICTILDELRPAERPYAKQIAFVGDRPGHDRRYAIDPGKIRQELQWAPTRSFATALRSTVAWYLDNQAWVESVTSGAYREWIAANYDRRGSEGHTHAL